ncbi:MAG TPA: DUF2958 domain-containing protein [Clostridia bacterium]|nr:DUF2958 domain-containing protein [Clostridia bacterium]
MKTIPASQPLDHYIRQHGVRPGEAKLKQFKLALGLRGTPHLRSQENAEDPTVYIKLFDPTGSWTFYILEWDQQDQIFGYCIGLVPEFGYASLTELASVKGQLGIGLEVDVWFLPQRLKTALNA